jgi:hypothetical protein
MGKWVNRKKEQKISSWSDSGVAICNRDFVTAGKNLFHPLSGS